jgi:Histidine kinase-, DNA gyrase B-, and HSP90-like ATPase
MTTQSFSIINTGMTVEAMRDSGYKSTTHALAEIIDNAIEAEADSIEVFGVSRLRNETGRHALAELAVLDNGKGMDAITLRRSLRYGDGTRQGRKGIGRFGVGLPNSSLSQATRVDIWSWQSGPTNALRTYLSIDDVQNGATEIPEPTLTPIPDVYLKSGINPLGDTGTLVVWSNLDRVNWKHASTTFKHTEILLGRIYRRFLAKPDERLHSKYISEEQEIGPQRQITLIPVVHDNGIKVISDDIVYIRPNDPLYLMSRTSGPEDFGPAPMFVEIEFSPFEVPVTFKGQTHQVRVRASYARPHVRDSSHPDASWPEKYTGSDAGHTDWGKHADTNMGVSMVRAHREIELDSSWVSGDDPRERWWKVEVDFPTSLDEVFGVTNNKQGTVTFQRLAKYDWRREAIPGEETPGDVRKRMEDDGDYRVHLLELRDQINNAIKVMRHRVKESNQKRGKRHTLDEDQKADAKATAAIKRRLGEGHKGTSDIAEETGTEQDHQDVQVDSLVNKHLFAKDDALRKVAKTVEAGNRVRWIQSHQSSPAFFDIDALPGVIQVALNRDHPVHSHLYDVMHPDVDELSEEEVRGRLHKAAAAFRILIYAWARFEDEQTDKEKRDVRNARIEWGKYAEEFFNEDDGSIPPTDMI